MQIQAGAEDTWIVSSCTGRVVCAFVEERAAREWLDNRKGNGVGYRLFCRSTDTVEVEHP